MAISVLQNAAADDGLAGATGTTQAVTLTVSAGSVLFVCVHYQDPTGTTTVTVADSVNGSYGAALDQARDTPFQRNVVTFQFTNAGAGSTTITATFSGTVESRAIAVMEIGGAKTSGALDGHTALNQTDSGGATDGLTSGNATNSNQPALLVGFSVNVQNGNLSVAGTGFTSQGSGWPDQPGTGFPTAMIAESKRITSTTAIAATFTATTGASEDFSVMMAIFDEQPVGAAVAWFKA